MGGVLEGACDLLSTAVEAQRSVQRQPVMALLTCPNKPYIEVSPAYHDFGLVAPLATAPKQASINVRNTGKANLVIGTLGLLPALQNHFSLVSTISGATIQPDQSLTFEVKCTPVSEGVLNCEVQIPSNAANAELPMLVSLAVTAGVPEIAVGPENYDFGAVLINAKATTATFAITNPGLAPLTVHSVEFSGASAGFKIQTGKVGGIISPSQTHPQARLEFTVATITAKEGNFKATLRIASDARGGKPVNVQLTMKVAQPKIAVKVKDASLQDVPLGGEAGLHVFVITNPGTAPLTISDIKLTAEKVFSFADARKPAEPIPPGGEWRLQIAFRPVAAKQYRAALAISSDAKNEKKPLALSLTAAGVAPGIEISMERVNFGSLYFGESKEQLLTIRNSGGAALLVSNITLDDARHFSLAGLPEMTLPIKPKDSFTFSVKSSPIERSLQTAQVTVESNAGSVPLRVELKVSGRLPVVTVQPDTLAVMHAQVSRQGKLTAAGKPAGGVYAWTIQDTDIANFVDDADPGNVAEVSLAGRAPGTTEVTVTYTAGSAPAASASMKFHVVHVAITQGARLELAHSDGQPAIQALTALGTPKGGQARFRPLVHRGGKSAAAYVDKNANSTLSTSVRTLGRSTATVDYEFAGVKAEATIDIDISTQSCSQVTWQDAGADKVTAVPASRCVHEQDLVRQRPSTAIPTVPAAFPHHHGDKCQHCTDAVLGQPVHHYINPDSESAAVTALKKLHKEITTLQGHFPDTWMPNESIPVAAQDYIASHPWLKGVSVWVFKPDGWRAPCEACKGTQTVGCAECGDTRFVTNIRKGKMIGVLVAKDAQGNIYHLRGVSGAFPGTKKTKAYFGAPNKYWARQLDNPANIPSASREWRNFGSVDERFGKCAATHLLAQALDQELELISMAEMWIGAAMGERVDGQLQSSCANCRQYFAHMLCDAGPKMRVRPYNGKATIPNQGLS